uniref:Uncharacterized protein n=1 Tax=Brassica campestris TaxID=3711 RepID=M4EWY1_BRACM
MNNEPLLLHSPGSSASISSPDASQGSSSNSRGSAALFEIVGVEFFFRLSGLVGVEFFSSRLRARRRRVLLQTLLTRLRRFLLQTHHKDLAQTAGDPRHFLRSSASGSSSDSPDSSASISSPDASQGSSSNSWGSAALFEIVGVEFFSSCITIWTPRVLAVLIYEFSSNLIPFKECFDSPDNR